SWRSVGHANWRAENGQIVATPQTPEGGWLIFDKSYQDVDLYTEFRCAAQCDVGVMTRAERTSDGGMKGGYVSLADGDSYDLTLNVDGKELSRAKLPRATAQFARMAAGPWTNGSAHVPGFAAQAITLAEQEEEAAKPPAARPAARAGNGVPAQRSEI